MARSEEEKEIILNLYKCHFTAKEVAEQVPFGYQTILSWFRSFKMLNVQQYNRLDLIPEETHDLTQCSS